MLPLIDHAVSLLGSFGNGNSDELLAHDQVTKHKINSVLNSHHAVVVMGKWVICISI